MNKSFWSDFLCLLFCCGIVQLIFCCYFCISFFKKNDVIKEKKDEKNSNS